MRKRNGLMKQQTTNLGKKMIDEIRKLSAEETRTNRFNFFKNHIEEDYDSFKYVKVHPSEIKVGDLIYSNCFIMKVIEIKTFPPDWHISDSEKERRGIGYGMYGTFVCGHEQNFKWMCTSTNSGAIKTHYGYVQGNQLASWGKAIKK